MALRLLVSEIWPTGNLAIRCVRMRTRHTDTDTTNRMATSSDSKRIRTQDARQMAVTIYKWCLASSVAWQSFEVVPNVIGPTSTTCKLFVHDPAVVHIMCSVSFLP